MTESQEQLTFLAGVCMACVELHQDVRYNGFTHQWESKCPYCWAYKERERLCKIIRAESHTEERG